MPTKCRKCGESDVFYCLPDGDVLIKETKSLLALFCKFAEANDLPRDKVCIQRMLLRRIVVRIDKRKCYFSAFHNNTRINEIKEAALSAYWILKFRPFMVTSRESIQLEADYEDINEAFALFCILSACKAAANKKGITANKKLSERLKREAMYAFKYWDLSKESMILIAETIGEAFCGIPSEVKGK